MRINNLELKQCNNHLMSGEFETCDIIKWNKYSEKERDGEYCISVAYWVKNKEGYDLKFVGNRPFEHCDCKEFWILAKIGQELLDYKFDLDNTE